MKRRTFNLAVSLAGLVGLTALLAAHRRRLAAKETDADRRLYEVDAFGVGGCG